MAPPPELRAHAISGTLGRSDNHRPSHIHPMTSFLHRAVSLAAFAVCAVFVSGCGPFVRVEAPAPERAWTADSRAGEIARWMRRECGRLLQSERPCMERGLVSLIDQVGLARAVEVLDTLLAVDAKVRANGHELAHGLGMAAYRSPETMAETFAACRPVQGAGCHHGVVQGYFLSLMREGRLPGTPELDAMCAPHKGVTFLYFHCAHGIGHGLMTTHANHVPKSLEGCDLASDPFVRESCYGGVFMENLVLVTHPHHTTEGHAATHGGHGSDGDARSGGDDGHGEAGGHGAHGGGGGHGATAHGRWKALDRDDPLYPCNAVGAAYQQACYTMQTGAILYFNGGNVAATGRACEQAPATMVETCFGSLGRDVIALAGFDHRRSLDLCARAAGMAGGRGEPWCMLGAVQNLVNLAAEPEEGMRFCRVVTSEAQKEECYRAVGELMLALLPAEAARGESCRGAEAAFVAACRRGARISAPAEAEATR